MLKKVEYLSSDNQLTIDLYVFSRENIEDRIKPIFKSDFLLYAPILHSAFCAQGVIITTDTALVSDPLFVVETDDLEMKLHQAILSAVRILVDSGVKEGEMYQFMVHLPTLEELDMDSIEDYIASKA